MTTLTDFPVNQLTRADLLPAYLIPCEAAGPSQLGERTSVLSYPQSSIEAFRRRSAAGQQIGCLDTVRVSAPFPIRSTSGRRPNSRALNWVAGAFHTSARESSATLWPRASSKKAQEILHPHPPRFDEVVSANPWRGVWKLDHGTIQRPKPC